eukprot:TRINITY_DN31495_c0_g1_i1.p2 TRINITY_DN31495_c0_g1~~TRINITY_DN31495_c0_g1_i1.p2  ORF type:complete len:110 (+),score=25.33 TRINITY_DN31495_c0_g1_i1:47-331(+)
MLRSLVGSEMCIRDRSTAGRCQAHPNSNHHPSGTKVGSCAALGWWCYRDARGSQGYAHRNLPHQQHENVAAGITVGPPYPGDIVGGRAFLQYQL